MFLNFRYAILFGLSCIVFGFACKQKSSLQHTVVIEGQAQGIPDGKLYLSDFLERSNLLDSAVCKNGHFRFLLKVDSSFAPFIGAITYRDSGGFNGMRSLQFRTHSLGADSLKNIHSGFMVERGETRIEGNNAKSPYLRVFGSPETDIMYKEQWGFGWLSNADSIKRQRQINYYKQHIVRQPASYYLLASLFWNKAYYSESELADLLTLFHPDLQRSNWGKRFNTYFSLRNDAGKPYPNLRLQDTANHEQQIIDPAAKLNMLIFWASWCHPCRMEIPVLKEINQAYSRKGLRLVSISIDESNPSWLEAAKEEQMLWQQLVTGRERKEQVQQIFNFTAIPLIVFIDREGKEIKRFTGYDMDGLRRYKELIESYL